MAEGSLVARQSDPSTFLQITIFLSISLSPPFLPTPHHTIPLPHLKLASQHRRCQDSSCLPLLLSQGSPALHTQLEVESYSSHLTKAAWRAGRLGLRGATLLTDCRGTEETVAVPPAMTGEQPPHCPAASQQAQSNATQNSTAGRAG